MSCTGIVSCRGVAYYYGLVEPVAAIAVEWLYECCLGLVLGKMAGRKT